MLTHGFVLDEQGRKMSKSLGNTLPPQTIAEKNGAEILRLWAASSDFTEDLRIGQDIIKANVDAYRRLRNTIRFMLANLRASTSASASASRRCRSWNAICWRSWPNSTRWCASGYAEFDFNRVYQRAVQFLHQRTVGLLFRHPQGRALLRCRSLRRAAAPRAP